MTYKRPCLQYLPVNQLHEMMIDYVADFLNQIHHTLYGLVAIIDKIEAVLAQTAGHS